MTEMELILTDCLNSVTDEKTIYYTRFKNWHSVCKLNTIITVGKIYGI